MSGSGENAVAHRTTKPLPRRLRGSAILAAALAAGIGLTACGSDDSSSSAKASASTSASASASASSCPTSSGGMPSGMPSGAPSGMPSGAAGGTGGGVSLGEAKTIKKTDNSTSTVIDPKGAQITCDTSTITSTDNITYSSPTTNGTKTDLKLDIQVPKSSGKKPLVVYITGGGWQSAERTGNLDQRTYLADQGYVVASIQYRTTKDGATYKDALADVKSAIRYLRANADTYGIDASEVAVWGQSAGGYLASMAGVTNGDKSYDVGDNLDQSSDVQGVVDEFGPANLSTIAADYDKAAQDTNYAAGNAAAEWVYGPGTKKSTKDYTSEMAAANPATHITSSTAPFILFHGSADKLVSPSQTLSLFNSLKDKGVDAKRVVLTGAGHGDLSFTGDTNAAKPWSTKETMGYITDFLAQHLK